MTSGPVTSRQGAYEATSLELLGEKAATLGRSARKMEIALARLADFDAGQVQGAERSALLKAAATAVWHFFIQREVCGFRDQRPVIAEYRIPRDVLKRLGAL